MEASNPWEDFQPPSQPQSAGPWDDFKSQPQDPGMFNVVSDNALQGATFGLGNRAEAGLAALVLSGMNNKGLAQNYEDARNQESQNLQTDMQQHPVASILSNLGGGLATGNLIGDTATGAALANSLRSGNVAARVAKGALAGSATGAAYGAGSADYGKTAEGAEQGAVTGALTGGAIPAAGAALSDVGGTLGNIAKGVIAKSPEAVQDAAQALKSGASDIYDKMRQVGAVFNPQATKGLVSDLQSTVSGGQFIPELNPKTTAVINHIRNAAQNGNLGLDDLDQYRRLLGRIGNSEDGVSAGAARKSIDSFVNNASGKDLVGGVKYTPQDLADAQNEMQNLQNLQTHLEGTVNAKAQLAGQQGGFWRGRSVTDAAQDAQNLANVKQQIADHSNLIDQIKDNIQNAPLAEQKANEAVGLLNQGRKQYQQASKFEDVSDILTKADGDGNKIKSGLTRFMNNSNNTRGWSPEEKNVLQEAAGGGGTEKLLKMGGKFGFDLGHSLTMGNTLAPVVGSAVGALAGGLTTGGIVPALGTLARAGQNLAAKGKAQTLLNVLENGGGRAASLPVSPLLSAPAASAAQQIGSKTSTAIPSMPQTETITAPAQPMSYNKTQPDTPMMQAFSKAESNNNADAKNPNSSASGLMQFTNKTWADMVSRYGKQTGINLSDKANPQAQQVMARLYANDNIKSLEGSLGRAPSIGEVYMAHVLGANGAAKLITADPNKEAIMLFPRQVLDANRQIFFNGRQPRTVSEVQQILTKKVTG